MMTGVDTIQSERKAVRVITEEKVSPRDMEPKYQEWKSDAEYGFNSYEELMRNYE